MKDLLDKQELVHILVLGELGQEPWQDLEGMHRALADQLDPVVVMKGDTNYYGHLQVVVVDSLAALGHLPTKT